MSNPSRQLPRAVLMALVGLAAAGCPSKPDAQDPEADAGAVASADAGAAGGPSELTLTVQAHFPDGGAATIPLAPGSRPTVDPASRLEVTLEPALANYRLRLFDETDRIVESDDQAEELGPNRLDYRLGLLAPLRPGRRYSLVVDAQTGDSILDRHGHKHGDQRLEFATSGEREKPAPAKAAKKSKKRRRR